MAHYAFINNDNIVTEVIVGKNEGEDGTDWEQWYGEFRGQPCKRTSYNTYGGQHSDGGTPYRKNYAGIGYKYDSALDAFYAPQPYPSWILDEDTCVWEAPVAYPSGEGNYSWNEAGQSWDEITL